MKSSYFLRKMEDVLELSLSPRFRKIFLQASTSASLRHDTRITQKGDVFIALDGQQRKASDNISAVLNTASLIISDAQQKAKLASLLEEKQPSPAVLFVKNLPAKVASIAKTFYKEPSMAMKCIALTGTKGKTSSCYMLEHLYRTFGSKAGILSTIVERYPLPNGGFRIQEHPNTTPSAIDIQTSLANMRKAAIDTVILEASSHGLELGRLDGLELDSAVFSNLSREHLDFHGSLENYFFAKLRLFSLLEQSAKKTKQGFIALSTLKSSFALEQLHRLEQKNFQLFCLDGNLEYTALLEEEFSKIYLKHSSQSVERFFHAKPRENRKDQHPLSFDKKKSKTPLLSFSYTHFEAEANPPSKSSLSARSKSLNFEALKTKSSPVHTHLQLHRNGELWAELSMPFFGQMNAENMALALMEFLASHSLNQEQKQEFLSSCSKSFQTMRIPGRIEWLKSRNPNIIIDYAHSPAALFETLTAIRSLKQLKSFQKARIFTLFGCGGDRDPSKRPLMGAIAYALSDRVIVSSDNPRTEDPEKIIAEVAAGIIKKQKELKAMGHHTQSEKSFITISNREQALLKAIDQLRNHDILLVAGKGHERYQITSTGKRDFNEIAIIEQALKKR